MKGIMALEKDSSLDVASTCLLVVFSNLKIKNRKHTAIYEIHVPTSLCMHEGEAKINHRKVPRRFNDRE